MVEFLETSIFTREADKLLTDEEQRELQQLLLGRPDQGDILEGSGGLRKVRFGVGNKGKSGGVRTIYYHHSGRQIIFLLLVYPKSRQDDLTNQQKKALRQLVEKEFK